IVQSIVQQKAQQTAKDLRGKANIEYVDSEIKTQVAQETEAAAQKQKAFEQQIDEQLKLEQQKKDEKK
ncbi:MAG: peptidylprolyl isomerase, partial [Hyphomicrobium sp.]